MLPMANANPGSRYAGELAGAERRFRALMEHAADGICLLDVRGTVLYTTPALERMLGCTPEELAGIDALTLLHPDDREQGARYFRALLDGAAPPPAECRLRRKEGGWRAVEAAGVNLLTDAAVNAVLFNFRDITDRIAMREALRASEERYRALEAAESRFRLAADRVPMLMWTAGTDKVRSWLNSRWVEFAGEATGSDAADAWQASVHPDDLPPCLAAFTACFEARGDFRAEYRMRRRDGEYRWVLDQGVPLFAGDGTLTGYAGCAIDITDRKRSESVHLENEAWLRALFESASQGIVTVDAGGRIQAVNNKLEEMFGYSRAELVGQPLDVLVPEQFHEAHAAHMRSYFARPRTRPMGGSMQLAARRKDGSEFPVEVGLSFVAGSAGGSALAFISDITERKRAEEAVRESQKLETVGVLAGGIAHDFNNLLVGIMGNASLLEEHVRGAADRDAAAEILIASERAAELTRQLLAYAGKGRFEIRAVDLSGAVREIAGLVRSSIPKNVRLELRLADGLPLVYGDPRQIQQVAASLIINGAEAIPEDRQGTVAVSTGVQIYRGGGAPAPGRYVRLEVRDDGCGMDEEMQARIFDPFFTTKFQGRGLGLSAVQGIVRGHRGVLRVNSRKGRGSTFEVLFPAG